MQKLSIADYFKKELGIKPNNVKLKKLQENTRDSYEIRLEKQSGGKEGMSLYYRGDKGLRSFLEDYLELFDPNAAANHNTIIVIDGKIRDIINNPHQEVGGEDLGTEKFTIDEIREMFGEFLRLDEMFSEKSKEIERWLWLRGIFGKEQ
jgi:hypothetical protein